MGEHANRLARMSEAWKTGKDKPPGPTDGQYEMQLQSAELKESQSGKLMIQREHVILLGEFAGQVVRDYMTLENEFGPRQVALWIQVMGYEAPEEVEQIEEIVAQIANDAPCYIGMVKGAKDSDLKNVTVKELIANPGIETAPAAPAAAKPKPAGKPAAKPAVPAADMIPVGTSVAFTDDGKDLLGTVQEHTPKGSYIVQTEDESLYEVDAENISVSEATTKEPVAEEPAAEEAPAEESKVPELLAFCQAYSLDGVTEESTEEELIEKINSFEFDRAELTTEEVALLEGIGGNFKKAAPAPKPAPKPVPKPAAPAAKPAAAKPAAKPAPKPAAAKPKPAAKPAGKPPVRKK